MPQRHTKMTICAIKVCRNYKGRLKTTKKVTYHRIPYDPILRRRWIEIIRKSRGDDVWEPAKTSVICSEHFRAKDLVYNQKRRRLKKEAIPSEALFLTSLERDDDDESDDLLEETGNISDCVTNVLDDPKSLGSNEEVSFGVTKDNHNASSFCIETSDSISSNIKDIASGTTSSCLPEEATGSKIGDGQKKDNVIDIDEDFSDLNSVYDSPEKSKMRRDLRRRIRIQKKHTLKIQFLRRKNLRLEKKIATLKQIIVTLKQERYIDS